MYVIIMIDTLLIRPSLHFTSLQCTCLLFTSTNLKLHPTTLHYTCRLFTSTNLKLHPATLHYTCRHFMFFPFKLHLTTLHYTSISSHLNFLPLHFTSHHYNSPHFTSLHVQIIFATLLFLSLHPFVIAFLILFQKILGLQWKVPTASAGSWFQFLTVLFTKEYFPISVLSFLSLIFLIWSALFQQEALPNLSLTAFHALSPEHALKSAHKRAVVLR